MADQKQTVSPYEADPSKIPSKDLYADLPFYGRYAPKPDDFKPEREHILSTSPESLKYWESVLALCNDTNYAYKNEVDEDGRDVFAVGAVIIKSGHLHKAETRPYELNDANEVAAVAIAREPLAKLGIRVPEMYFAGKVSAPNDSPVPRLSSPSDRSTAATCSSRRGSLVSLSASQANTSASMS